MNFTANMKISRQYLAAITAATLMLSACSEPEQRKGDVSKEKAITEAIDPMEDRGIGPITNLTLGGIDEALAMEGESLFTTKCAACHKMDKRKIGPAMVGIMSRRSPEWIMNMILNPDEMVKENAQAKALFAEYLSPMANQSLTEPEARQILEYFRQYDNTK